MANQAQEGENRLPNSVRGWRIDALIAAGYPQEEAFLLAKRPDVDLHRACDLLASGCSVKLAIRILT